MVKKTLVALSAACAAGLALGTGVSLAAYAGTAQPSPTVVSPTADYDVSALTGRAGAEDAFPVAVADDILDDGLVKDSVRLVDTQKESQTYVAKNTEGLLCLVVFLPGDDWVAGTACTDPETFDEAGVGVRVESIPMGRAAEQYLLPDAAVSEVPALPGATRGDTPNLLVVDEDLSASQRDSLQRSTADLPISIVEPDED